MKRSYFDIFGLCAKASFWRVLAVMLLSSAAQAGLFYAALRKDMGLWSGKELAPEMTVGVSRIETLTDGLGFIFAICFLLVTVFLCLSFSGLGANTGYTLCRLEISERESFFVQAIYNSVVYVCLWAWEAATFIGLCALYELAAPVGAVAPQSVLMAFWRDELLHSVLPLSEWLMWIRNAVFCVSMGFAAAQFPYKLRRKKAGLCVIVCSALCLMSFKLGVGEIFIMVASSVTALIIAVTACVGTFGKEWAYED